MDYRLIEYGPPKDTENTVDETEGFSYVAGIQIPVPKSLDAMLTALLVGLAASSALVIGPVLGVFWEPPKELVAVALAFSSGRAPWRQALVTVMQFAENLSDRQAADAVRARLDWNFYDVVK